MILLSEYSRSFLDELAEQTGFIRDNLEKVIRLSDILRFIGSNPQLADTLVLKGGTAINLTVFNMPRLSVDIDLDFSRDCSREEMLAVREKIESILLSFVQRNGYSLNGGREKSVHSLSSWIFDYQNVGGNIDNIKVEINYSMRCHIFEERKATVSLPFGGEPFQVNTLAPVELFGSKIKAMLERCAPRDVYDVYNAIQNGIFDESEYDTLRKSVLFYWAVGKTGTFRENIPLPKMDSLDFQKVRQTLFPVIKKGSKLDLDDMKKTVSAFCAGLLSTSGMEKRFLHEFSRGNYRPQLLFDDADTVDRVRNHPMALWKCRNIKANRHQRTI